MKQGDDCKTRLPTDPQGKHMKTSHPAILLGAVTHTALTGLAALTSAGSILQGSPERALLIGVHPAAALLNLAAVIPAPAGSLRALGMKIAPALTGITASIVYQVGAQGPQRIQPELLLSMTALPITAVVYLTFRTIRTRRGECP